MADTPVVVFAYNRPAKLRQVLRALRRQPPALLIVFVDGPRRSDDRRGVDACRALALGVDWNETELHFSETNQGVAGIKDRIHAVLERFPAAIFLEDDCVPVPGFYGFMCAALERYRDHPQVFSIGAYQHLPAQVFQDYPFSLVAGARFIGWGWATWRAKWQRAWPLIEGYCELFDGLRRVPEVAGGDIGPAARRMAAGQGLDNWDLRVALAALALKQVHLVAVGGLVRTIGLDASGMHGSVSNALRARLLHNRNVARRAPEPAAWPEAAGLYWGYVDGVREFVRRSQALAIGWWARRGLAALRRRLERRRARVFDVDLLGAGPLPKRALLAYITHPFTIPEDDPRFHNHVNIFHAREMARALNGLGYCVDVIDYRDTDFRPQADYDLLIGHGGVNFARLADALPPATPKIYFSTGAYWRFHNAQEQQRLEALRRRRGLALPPDRPIQHGEDAALERAGAIIGIGNRFTRDTYAAWERVWMIPGTAKFDDTFDWRPSDPAAGRNHFLFFASGGNVHKGLDLALEAFAGLEQHLWVMAPLEAAFRRAYRRELFDLPNIHTLGAVAPRLALYYRTLRSCAWCLLPSCSEGQAQSVLEAMNAGLAPLVSRAAGVDVDGFGEWLEPPTVEAIRAAVTRVAALSPGEIARRTRLAQDAARSTYAPEAFGRNFTAALQAALAQPPGDEEDAGADRR